MVRDAVHPPRFGIWLEESGQNGTDLFTEVGVSAWISQGWQIFLQPFNRFGDDVKMFGRM